MPRRLYPVFRWPRLFALVLLSYYAQGQPPAEPLPELLDGGGAAAVLAAVQQAIMLPFGTPVPAKSSRVVVRFVVGTTGSVYEATIVQGLSPGVDAAVLKAVNALPLFRAVQRAGKFRPVPYLLTIEAPGAATPAQRSEAATRWQQTARRQPGETDSTFVHRVLPLSYPPPSHDKLLAYAWRPGAFGKQLFFTLRGGEANDGGTDLYVLDPYQPDTYAVQVLPIGSMGDLTDLAALFFADANQDGHKDLLALALCSLSEEHKADNGDMLKGHWDHYQTQIWQYLAPGPTGRPRYQADLTPRPYLDELATAAAVRQALARHQRRSALPNPTGRPGQRVK